MARRLGTAYIALEADASLFRTSAVAGMKKALAGVEARIAMIADASRVRAEAAKVAGEIKAMHPEMVLGLDARKIDAQLAAEYAKLATLNRKMSALKIDADAKALVAKLAGLEAQAAKLRKSLGTMRVDTETVAAATRLAALNAQAAELKANLENLETDTDIIASMRNIQALEAEAGALRAQLGGMDINLHTAEAMARLLAVRAQITELKSSASDVELVAKATSLLRQIDYAHARIAVLKDQAREVRIGPDIAGDAPEKLAALLAEAHSLADTLEHMRADVNTAGMVAKIAALQLAVQGFTEHLGSIDLDTGSLGAAQVKMLELVAAQQTLAASSKAMNAALLETNSRWGFWLANIAAIKVALYGGISQVGAWHLALDALVETFAILVPAAVALTVGLGAFGAAAVESARQVVTHLKNVGIVAEATGKLIPPMTGAFEKMADAARPQVLELYGAALNAMGSKMGFLSQMAQSTGGVLDSMAAKLVAALAHGGEGFAEFMAHGQDYLKSIGDIFTNIGHFISYTVKVAEQTGIARVLLGGLDAASKLLGVIEKIPLPLAVAAVAIHGWYIWGGVLGTIGVGLLRVGTRMTAVAAGAKNAGTAFAELKAAGGAGAFALMGASLKDMGTNLSLIPTRIGLAALAIGRFAASGAGAITGVAVLAAGLAALILVFGKVKDGTDKFIDSMNQMVANASVFNTINTTSNALVLTVGRLSDAQAKLSASTKAGADAQVAAASGVGAYAENIKQLQLDIQRLTGERDKLTATLATESGHLTQIAAQYGLSLPAAMALAATAGVKTADLQSKNVQKWAEASQKIANLVKGYADMGQGLSQLGADMNVLTVTGSDQAKMITQLNTAWDTFMKTVSAPVSTFITFAEAITKFGGDADQAGAKMTGLGGTIISQSKKLRTTSMQLQEDFIGIYTSAYQVADAMRAAQAPAEQQVYTIKRLVEAMIPLAGGNKAAAAMISALAQQAAGPATTSLQQLAQWAGKTKNPLMEAKTAAEQASTGFSNLSRDAQKLGQTLQQDMATGMAKAVENALGVQAAMNKLANDVLKNNAPISQVKEDYASLNQALTVVTGSGPAAASVIKSISQSIVIARESGAKTSDAMIKMVTDIGTVGGAYGKVTGDINAFTSAIRVGGLATDEAKTAAKNLVNDLIASGIDPAAAKRIVGNLGKMYADEFAAGIQSGAGKVAAAAGKMTDAAKIEPGKLAKLKAMGAQMPGDVADGINSGKGKVAAAAGQVGEAFAQGLQYGAAEAGGAASKLMTYVQTQGLARIGDLTSLGSSAASAIASGISSGAGAAGSGVSQLMTYAKTAGLARIGDLTSLGSQSGNAIASGIKSGTGAAAGAVGALQGTIDGLHGKIVSVHTSGTAEGKGQVSGLQTSIDSLHGKNVHIGMTGTGTFSIKDLTGQGLGVQGAPPGVGLAAGGQVRGPGGPTSDQAGLYALSSGEWVIRAASASQYGPAAMQAVNTGQAVIGYAAGGPAYSGSVEGLGSYAQSSYALFGQTMTAEMVKAISAAMKKAMAEAVKAMAAAASAGMAASGSARDAQKYAASQLAKYGWGPEQMAPLIALWNAESGWNANAVNPSSGAAGIAQSLGHGPVPLGNASAQIDWGLGYIKSKYGSPAAAWSFWQSQSPHWYGQGGPVGLGQGGPADLGGGGPAEQGKGTGQGLISGMQSTSGDVTSVAGGLGRGIVAAISDALETGSPSKATAKLGKQAIAGLVLGLQGGKDAVTAAATTIAAAVVKPFTDKTISATIAKMADMIKPPAVMLSEESGPAAWLRADNARLQKLARQRQDLLGAIAKADELAQTTLQAVGVTTAETYESIAASVPPASALSFITGMKAQLADVQAFAAALKQLSSLGLNATSMAQIAQAGVQGGLSIAQSIAAGGKEAVAEINKLQSQLAKAAGKVGDAAGPALYAAGVQAGKALAQGLRSELGEVAAAMKALANAMVNQLKAALKAKSPSRVMIELGATIPQGLAIGIGRDTPLARKATSDMAGSVIGKLTAGPGYGTGPDAFAAAFKAMNAAKNGSSSSTAEKKPPWNQRDSGAAYLVKLASAAAAANPTLLYGLDFHPSSPGARTPRTPDRHDRDLASEIRGLRADLRGLLGYQTSVIASTPALTGRHVAAGINSAAGAAAFRARYPHGGV